MQTTELLQGSLLYRLQLRLSTGLYLLGSSLKTQWRQSRTAQAVRCLRTKTKESLLLGWVTRLEFTGLLLVFLALFPVLDARFSVSVPIGAVTLGWNEILLILCALTVLLQRIFAEKPLLPCLTPAALPILQFPVVGLGLLCAVTLFPQIGREGYYVTVGALLWCYILTRLLRSEKDALLFCRLLLAVAAVISLIGIFEYIFAVPIPKTWLETAETDIRTRAYAIFANPNQLGEYLELMLPLGVGMLYFSKNKKEKFFYFADILLMLAAGLFTMSRGAWIAIAAALFLFALLEDRRLVIVFLICGVFALLLPFVFSRLSFLFTDAYSYSAAGGGRLVRWQTALRYLSQGDPWLGLGFGMYGGEVASRHPIMKDWTYYWVDNYYVRLLAENGIVGLASFLVMQLGLFGAGLYARAAARSTPYRFLISAILASVTGIGIHCMLECVFDVRFISVLYWMLAGLMLWLGFLRERNKTEIQSPQTASL